MLTEPTEHVVGVKPYVLLLRKGWPWFAIEVVVTHAPTPEAAHAIGQADAHVLVVQPTWDDLGGLVSRVSGVAYKPAELTLEAV